MASDLSSILEQLSLLGEKMADEIRSNAMPVLGQESLDRNKPFKASLHDPHKDASNEIRVCLDFNSSYAAWSCVCELEGPPRLGLQEMKSACLRVQSHYSPS